ncbi:MAG: ATP-binding protein, partial [Pseudonocardiaceae bacterium]
MNGVDLDGTCLSAAAPQTPARPYPLGVPHGWPLTGRAEELNRLSELTLSRDGPAGVVLAGPAGVGKTRLARETLA